MLVTCWNLVEGSYSQESFALDETLYFSQHAYNPVMKMDSRTLMSGFGQRS